MRWKKSMSWNRGDGEGDEIDDDDDNDDDNDEATSFNSYITSQSSIVVQVTRQP